MQYEKLLTRSCFFVIIKMNNFQENVIAKDQLFLQRKRIMSRKEEML
ncbi:hypothetical protein SAMN02910317_02970 [Ruminococcaceae bacterium FB2012]|nr:hypothetical protein SAMN02910317_02970 [Ruminococcaceae bacterium FB2012]